MGLFDGLLGGLFGGSNKQQPVQTTGGSKPEIPKQLLPYYEGTGGKTGILPTAEQQFGQTKNYFPGPTVVPFSGLTQQGMGQVESMAQQPNQLAGAAQGGLLDVLQGNKAIDTAGLENVAGGGMLGQNPYIDQLVQQVSGDASQAVNDNAYFGGREGSPYHAGAVAEGVGRATAPIRYGDYQAERGLMQNAMGQLAGVQGQNINNQFNATQLAPQVDEFQYGNANRLLGLGAAQEGKLGENYQDKIARYNFAQNERPDALARYAATVGGTPVLSNQTTGQLVPQSGGFSGGGLLGGAYTGAAIGNSLFPGAGGLYGAGIGGLLGGFG